MQSKAQGVITLPVSESKILPLTREGRMVLDTLIDWW